MQISLTAIWFVQFRIKNAVFYFQNNTRNANTILLEIKLDPKILLGSIRSINMKRVIIMILEKL